MMTNVLFGLIGNWFGVSWFWWSVLIGAVAMWWIMSLHTVLIREQVGILVAISPRSRSVRGDWSRWTEKPATRPKRSRRACTSGYGSGSTG